jgi:outer membrane protein TolC
MGRVDDWVQVVRERGDHDRWHRAGPPHSQGTVLVRSWTSAPWLVALIPVGDGAALIKRRPDVREAERRLAAATAEIGVATADLYPTIRQVDDFRERAIRRSISSRSDSLGAAS